MAMWKLALGSALVVHLGVCNAPTPASPCGTVAPPAPTPAPVSENPCGTEAPLPTCGAFKCGYGKEVLDSTKVCSKKGCTGEQCCSDIPTTPTTTPAPTYTPSPTTTTTPAPTQPPTTPAPTSTTTPSPTTTPCPTTAPPPPTTITTTPAPTQPPTPPPTTITTTPAPTQPPTTPAPTHTTTPAPPVCGDFTCPKGEVIPERFKVCDKDGCTAKLCCVEPNPCTTAAPEPATDAPTPPPKSAEPANPCAIVPAAVQTPAPAFKKFSVQKVAVAEQKDTSSMATWAFPVVGLFGLLSCISLGAAMRKASRRQTRQVNVAVPINISDETGLLEEGLSE